MTTFEKLYDKDRADLITWWLRCLIDDEWDKLSEWEQTFVDSVNDQFKRRGDLSDKQMEVLDRIYTERT